MGSAVTTFFNSRNQERRIDVINCDGTLMLWAHPRVPRNDDRFKTRCYECPPPGRGCPGGAREAPRSEGPAPSRRQRDGGGTPDARVRVAATEFATELFNAGHSVGWLLREDRHDNELREAADEDHRKALDLYAMLRKFTTAYGDKKRH